MGELNKKGNMKTRSLAMLKSICNFFGASTGGLHPGCKAESLSMLKDLVKGVVVVAPKSNFPPETVTVTLSIVLLEVYCFIIIITCLMQEIYSYFCILFHLRLRWIDSKW